MNCAFGCKIFKEDESYLAFIDGMAEQIVCAACARDIEKKPMGMTGVIGKIGSDEVNDYVDEINEQYGISFWDDLENGR